MDDLFLEVINKIEDGMTITFTKDNVADGDEFLMFDYYKEQKVTFHTDNVPYWIDFDEDEPMLLEEVPESFLESILKNIG